MSAESRDPLAYVRWLDVALVVATAPVLLLAGLPALGVIVGSVVWVLQRIAGHFIELRARRSGDVKTFAGLMLASTLGRAWLSGLTILAAGLAGERRDGLTAAVLLLAAFTVYFALSLILRPERKTQTP